MVDRQISLRQVTTMGIFKVCLATSMSLSVLLYTKKYEMQWK